ncbi:MAG: glycoside hydrolase family 172 protein [Christensenellaceae bacterium]
MTYADLVYQLIDLPALALPPKQGEAGGCFSSYDRASKYDEATDLYIDWGANADGTGYLRKEGNSIVALELDGPGVIWRVWSALPKRGHIRIFVDHEDTPILDQPFQDFFEAVPGELCPKNYPELLPILSRGRNSFIPIPFQKHIKILLDEDWGMYYHFTYNRFSEDTILPRLSINDGGAGDIALAEVDRLLAQRDEDFISPETGDTLVPLMAEIPAGEAVTIYAHDAPAAIRSLQFATPRLPTITDAALLRGLTISMYWDGCETPQVWSPFGDFFGAAPGIKPYASLPLGMSKHRLFSHWYMPFSACKIVIENETQEPVPLVGSLLLSSLQEAPENLLRFHAKWHRGTLVSDTPERFEKGGDRWPDWPLLQVKGSGRYAGMHLHVYNDWKDPAKKADAWWYGIGEEKSIDWWWGEGDEKFFIDGEKFPSTFGTGSEDYVGYAWAAEPPFSMFESAFAAQPYTPIDGKGHTSVNRFHIADNIPFQKSFDGFLEKYWDDNWGESGKCLYATTVYFYLSADGTDPYEKTPYSLRYGYDHL